MKPVNNKSLLHFIFDQMEKLDSGKIDVDQAKAQALLAKQANNSYRYELDRVSTEIKLREFNLKTGANIELRNVDGKNFE